MFKIKIKNPLASQLPNCLEVPLSGEVPVLNWSKSLMVSNWNTAHLLTSVESIQALILSDWKSAILLSSVESVQTLNLLLLGPSQTIMMTKISQIYVLNYDKIIL